MGLDMSITAKATSGQRIEIRRWRKNVRLMGWFMERAKLRGEDAELEGGVWATDITKDDISEQVKFADDDGFEGYQFLDDIGLDSWDVHVWECALRDGFTLTFYVT